MTIAAPAPAFGPLVGRRRLWVTSRSAIFGLAVICIHLVTSLPCGRRSAECGGGAGAAARAGSERASASCELVESAELALRRTLLVQEGELALVELAEELVPFDGFEVVVVLVVVAGKRDAQQAHVVALLRALHVRRLPAA